MDPSRPDKSPLFRPVPDSSRRCHETDRYQRTAPSFSSSSVMGTSPPPVLHPHEHGGQNESSQEYGDVHEESIQSGSPAAFSTENNEFSYQTPAIETDMDTDNSTAVICGQLNNILTTATALDGELVCGQCENVLIEPPCETPSKIQEQIDSDDYPDTDNSTAVICGQLNNILTTATVLDGELVCGQCENVLIEPPCETPSKIQEQIEAVVANVLSDTSDDELLDREDR